MEADVPVTGLRHSPDMHASAAARCFAALALVLASSQAHAWSKQETAHARAILSRFVDQSVTPSRPRPPALSVAVGVNGALMMAEGFGNAGGGAPPDADTIYRIGSITKQFTAAAILRLIELGAICRLSGKPLTLDTPVSEIIEGVENWKQPGQAAITVRSLLTMTSNLPNFTRRPPPHLDPWGAIAAPELLGAVKMWKPDGWPSSFEYSNTSYFILAAIVDALQMPGGEPSRGYRQELRRLIVDDLHLRASGFAGQPLNGLRLAEPNYRRKPAFGAPDWLRGSGDMVSSARDIQQWNALLLGGHVIDEASQREMFGENARVTPTIYYGMGWYVSQLDGLPLYSHSGTVPGYTAFNAICRDEARGTWVSVTLLTNSDGIEDLGDLAETLLRIAFEK